MKTRWMLTLTCLLGVGVAGWLTADDATEGDADAAKPDSFCADLSMAMDLVAYGRENNAPEALICARIIGTTPTTEDTDNFVCETEHAEEPQGSATAESLLAEAAEMSDAPHIQTLVAQVTDAISEAARGEVGGPGSVRGCVGDHQMQEWHGDFYGGEWAEVSINGDGYSDSRCARLRRPRLPDCRGQLDFAQLPRALVSAVHRPRPHRSPLLRELWPSCALHALSQLGA